MLITHGSFVQSYIIELIVQEESIILKIMGDINYFFLGGYMKIEKFGNRTLVKKIKDDQRTHDLMRGVALKEVTLFYYF